jgi:hypothetical protein
MEKFDQRFRGVDLFAVQPNPGGERRDHVEIAGQRADDLGAGNMHPFRFRIPRINRPFTMFAVLFCSSIPQKGPVHMAFRANQQLREDMWDYRYRSAGPSVREPENVLSFNQPAPKDYGTTALSLVHQAAEIFSGMENQAREAEARAQSMCKSLAEKLQLAENQRDASERARRDVVNELNGKLQEVSRALQQAQSRIVDAEDHATAAEFRAQAAEIKLYKANQELAAVENAIRKRLL